MTKKIRVRDVVQEMDVGSDTITVYLSKRTGDFIRVTEEEALAIEAGADQEDMPDGLEEDLPNIREALEGDDCVALPNQFEIHEWAIMRDFSSTLDDKEIARRLLNAIHGPGAFRYFRDKLLAVGLQEQWYRFREAVLEKMAIDWLEANGIPYDRDSGDV